MPAEGAIHVGIGGWDFDPWRGTFYPEKLARSKQLHHLGTRLNSTEINATYYKMQTPALFESWRKMVPDGFKFAIKASRFCTNRKSLADAGESIGRFCAQGFTELGDKLGPILWQFMPTKQFEREDFRAFLALLPTSRDGIVLRHALEVRHESFRCREFVALARAAQVGIAIADHETYPMIPDLSADFVYARLQRAEEKLAKGYAGKALDRWAAMARGWAQGKNPTGLDYVSDAPAPEVPRETFVFFIGADKVRNPAAALALTARLA